MLHSYNLDFFGDGWGCKFHLASEEVWEQTELEYTIAEVITNSEIDVTKYNVSFPEMFAKALEEHGIYIVCAPSFRAVVSFHEVLDFLE